MQPPGNMTKLTAPETMVALPGEQTVQAATRITMETPRY